MSAQANIVQINTKTILVTMGAFMATMMATTLISVGMIVPSLAHADTVQTANANPVYQVPAGYTLVPASTPTGSCAGTPASAGVVSPAVSLHTMPAALAMALPNYSSVINQTHNETNTNTSYNYDHSFNTRGDEYNDSNNNNGSYNTADSNNGNGSNNGNNSNNTTDSNNTNTVNTTTNTTTTNDSHDTTNSNNTDNSNTTTTSVSNASNVIVANGTISL